MPHSIIEQIHRITDIIEKTYEEKQMYAVLLLDAVQAFDKVWYDRLTS